MSVQAQLEYESRTKIRYAAIAVFAGLLLVLSVVVALTGPQSKLDELTLSLITEHKRSGYDVLGAVADGVGYLTLAWVLSYLVGISRARKPDIQSFIRWLVIAGAVFACVGGVAYHVIFLGDANTFVAHGSPETYMQAEHLTNGAGIPVVGVFLNLGLLLLTVGFVWVSLNAMRVGLLPRPMGYVGMLCGVFVIFPVGFIAPFVQAAWLLALAYLLTGRWISGLPKAWETGQMEPWATPADQRAARAGGRSNGRAARPEKLKPAKATVVRDDDGEDEDTAGSGGTSRTRADTPKRKRKRRN